MVDFMDFPTARERVIQFGHTTIGVIPEICLVSHFQVGAWEVLYRPAETGNVKRWGLPLMIPNFSYLNNGIFVEKGTTLPMHGFGRHLAWSVVDQQPASISLQLVSNDVTRAQYPYDFTFTATIEAGEGTLTYRLTIENRDEQMLPISPGFHPYFAIAQKDKPKLVTDGPPGFAVSAFHWDTSPPDQIFSFHGSVTTEIPRRGTLNIAELPFDGQRALKYMQIWSEPVNVPDHAFVCLEPVVAGADGLNQPEQRLNIDPHASQTIVLQLTAEPL
jgi:galactose mutarotase-like enzyme